MPVTCIVVGCGSRGNRDKVSCHVVPDVVNSKYFPHLNDLSRKRRQKWIAAIKRDDLTPSILRNQKVCSKHFITGKPSKLEDVQNADWVPSQHMGHVSLAISKRKDAIERKDRVDKRKKLSDSGAKQGEMQSKLLHLECQNADGQTDGVSSQTHLTMEDHHYC